MTCNYESEDGDIDYDYPERFLVPVDDDSLERFLPIIKVLKLRELPSLAAAIREAATEDEVGRPSVDPNPLCGSFNILYKITFSDGVAWIVKIHETACHDRYNEDMARRLKTEALTMRYVHRQTSIPVPEVFAYDTTFDNAIGVPFILMQYVSGMQLPEIWFDQTCGEAVQLQRRRQALEDIAKAVLQLSKFTFDQGGFIQFDENEQPVGVVEETRADLFAIEEIEDCEQDDEGSYMPTRYYSAGPAGSPEEWFNDHIRLLQRPVSAFIRGIHELLKLFISWIPEPEEPKQFVLALPDFDLQNFIVSRDGHLQAVIDWDGAATVPWSVGPEGFPKWLMRDMDSSANNHDASHDENDKCNSEDTVDKPFRDSGSTLAEAREMYGSIVASIKRAGEAGEVCHSTGTTSINLTRNSRLVNNLVGACSNPLNTVGTVTKVFNEAARAVGTEFNDDDDDDDDRGAKKAQGKEVASAASNDKADMLNLYDVAIELGAGTLDSARMRVLEQGFRHIMGIENRDAAETSVGIASRT